MRAKERGRGRGEETGGGGGDDGSTLISIIVSSDFILFLFGFVLPRQRHSVSSSISSESCPTLMVSFWGVGDDELGKGENIDTNRRSKRIVGNDKRYPG